MNDFGDPRQEWRRLFSELFGTFLLVLVAAGGGMMGASAILGCTSSDRRPFAVGAAWTLRGARGGRSGSVAAQGALFTGVEQPDKP